jgi:catechol 2,3-dioxygenase-like lactoylglutathione lyase family enzyme
MTSSIESILLASAHPERLRRWYVDAFDVQPDVDGHLYLGSVNLIVDGRDDVDPTTAEPGRVILNHHVPDIHAAAKRLDEMRAPWVAPVEYRDAGLWFGTVEDPDGNYVQLIQTTPDYWVLKRQRAGASSGPLTGASLGVRLPAQDVERARRFYSEVLGLDPIDERPGGLLYNCFTVPNLDDAVAQLRARGLEFEAFEFGDLPVTDGIVTIPGYYSTKPPTGERAIWFRDSEGNLLGLGEHTFD